jgi:hypothetical protein
MCVCVERFKFDQGNCFLLPSGMAARHQHIVKRGQYFAYLTEELNCTAAELDAYLVEYSISDAEHSKQIGEAPDPLRPASLERAGCSLPQSTSLSRMF